MSTRDIIVWSLVALLSAVPLVYLPALALLSRLVGGSRPRWLFIVVAIALGVIPTAMIMFCWGGGLAELVSPEARLFCGMFAVVGVVLGLAYSSGRRSPA
jgi:hypothetical protein